MDKQWIKNAKEIADSETKQTEELFESQEGKELLNNLRDKLEKGSIEIEKEWCFLEPSERCLRTEILNKAYKDIEHKLKSSEANLLVHAGEKIEWEHKYNKLCDRIKEGLKSMEPQTINRRT